MKNLVSYSYDHECGKQNKSSSFYNGKIIFVLS